VLHAKSGIILMVLPFAILLPVLFYRTRQPFVAYAVFSLHFYAFVLLLFCASLSVAAVDALLGGAGLTSTRMDNALSVINLAACATYLYLAMGTAYGAGGALRTTTGRAASCTGGLCPAWAVPITLVRTGATGATAATCTFATT
jgi:hypothetical protein